MILQEKINKTAEDLAQSLGYEFIASEIVSGLNHQMILRIYLDKDGGINLKDCGNFSKIYSKMLDVELQSEGKYTLEVSSPGANRLLVKKNHFEKYIGSTIKVRLKQGVNNRKNFKGKLLELVDEVIKVDVDGEVYSLNYSDIDKANLVAEF